MIDVRFAALKYLADFSRQDVGALSAVFSDAVTLRDWDLGTVRGKAAVLAANEKIFSSVKSIEARPLTVHVAGQTAIAELEVHVDGKLAALVVDIIDFGDDGRINAIRAYRGT